MAKRDERYTSEKLHPAEDGGEHRVHLDIITARWVGSAPPNAQAYAEALAQWRKLPGVIATSATDLGLVIPTDDAP